MIWEYNCGALPAGTKEAKLSLDDVGSEGWELVTVVFNGVQMVAFFKRPKRTP